VNSSQSVTVRLVGWATVTGGAAAATGGAALSSQPDKVTASRTMIGPRLQNEPILTIRAKRPDFSVALTAFSPELLSRSIEVTRTRGRTKMRSADSLFKNRSGSSKICLARRGQQIKNFCVDRNRRNKLLTGEFEEQPPAQFHPRCCVTATLHGPDTRLDLRAPAPLRSGQSKPAPSGLKRQTCWNAF
jgi:hypothetical protein